MDDITDKSSEELFLVVHLKNKSNTGTDSTDSDTINNKSISTASTTTVNKSKIMGVENTWNEEENFYVPTAADFPIPLPPPPVGFDDLSTAGCPVDVVESGTLEVLFSTNEDQENQTDHLIIDDTGNGDVSDGDSEAGVCGLRNLGNTCFMSTGVQCLVATPSLIRCLLDKTILDSDATVSSDSLTAQLAALTNKMWSGHYSSVQPADFKHSLGTLYPQFKDFRQHDCQEFLALLLDGLHEQMNCANGKISTLVNSNNNNSFETAGDSDDTNCDINKQKLDCGSNVQCSGCWSPKKEFLDFNNYNYNNNNNNNCNSASNGNSHNSVIKKELNGYKDKIGFTKMPSSSTSAQAISMPADSSLCSDLSKDANKINDNVLCATNNNNKINDFCSSNSSDNIISNNSDVSMSDNYESSKTNRDELDLNGDTEHNHWYNGSCLTGIQDIMKDAKTSNVNVLVTEQEINNEIRFDSEKFPKNENSLRRKETLNFNAFHIYDNNTSNNTNSGKRVKSTVTHYNCVSDFRERLDLKRIKMHRFECDDYEKDKNIIMEYQNNKSKTIDINLVEKNLRIECERKQRELDGSVNPVDLMNVVSDAVAGASGGCSSFFVGNGSHVPQNDKNHISTISSTSSDGNFFNSVGDDDDDREGDTHWEKHLATNQSIIVDTFQGQFKSTVVCSACKYVSVTYEPFMYLSVPLPHAMERQICVTFIPNDPHCNSVQYLITLNKRDKISKLKEQLIHLLNSIEIKGSSIILAEVFDNHIAKILNDNHLIRYVDDINRHIYAFELLSLNTIAAALNENMADDSVDGKNSKNSPDSNINIGPQNVGDGNGFDSEDWNYNEGCGNSADDDQQMTASKSCIICLEEKESNMLRHVGCICVLCDVCVKSSFQHYGGDTLICPVCRVKLNPDTDLVPVTNDVPSHPVVRMFMVPIVYRIDMLGDGNNNKKTVKLFGHPNVVRLRNNISSEELYKIMSYIVPYAEPYKILLVDGQGRHCSRCMFNKHCRGCAVNIHNGPLNLTTGDTLAVTFVRSVEEPLVERHSSLSAYRSQQPLTLYDCIQAFSQSEVLDKQNPWYCPECKQNQCATKTLSVWRCPDYLIVYLKRFVYQDGMSTKLEDKVMFPFHGLNLITSVSYSTVYDLYACVCHVGGVSAGHYTAYTQHPKTGEWHYYNDDVVAKQMPQEEDYSNAYILFYRKRGLTGRDTGVADNDNGEGCSSYNTI